MIILSIVNLTVMIAIVVYGYRLKTMRQKAIQSRRYVLNQAREFREYRVKKEAEIQSEWDIAMECQKLSIKKLNDSTKKMDDTSKLVEQIVTKAAIHKSKYPQKH